MAGRGAEEQRSRGERHFPNPGTLRILVRGVREAYDYLGSVLAISALVMLLAFPIGLGAGTATLGLMGPRGAELARALWTTTSAERDGETATQGGATRDSLRRSEGDGGAKAVLRDLRHLAVAVAVGSIVCWTLMGPLLAGSASLVRQILAREDPVLVDLFREARARARLGTLLAGVQAFVGQLLLVDLVFFLSMPSFGLKLVASLFLYASLYWGMMLSYQWPLLAEGAGSVVTIVRKSALLVLDNLPLSLGLGVFTLLFSLLCALTGIGLVLLWAGVLMFVHAHATRELLRKYGVLEPEAGS